MIHTSCPACGANDMVRFLDRPDHPISVFWKDYETIPEIRGRFDLCRQCGHVFLTCAYDDPLYSDVAARMYAGYELLDIKTRPFPQRDAHYLGAVEFLSGLLDFRGRDFVLEIGSNRGDFLYLLKEAAPGFNVTGVEPAQLTFQGVPTIRGFFDETTIGGKFDLLVMRHVLEHIRDPLEILCRGVSLLNDQGQIFIEVPNMHFDMANTIECFIPEHIHHFCEYSLATLLKRAGLSVSVVDRSCPEGLRLLAHKSRPNTSLENYEKIDSATLEMYTSIMAAWVQRFEALLEKGVRPAFYGFGNIFLCTLSELKKTIPMKTLLDLGAVILDDTPSKIGLSFQKMDIIQPDSDLLKEPFAVIVCTMNPTHRDKMKKKILELSENRAAVLFPWEKNNG
nr:methyltransferase domain-containing protein [uncultured Desulfobacter sp.]